MNTNDTYSKLRDIGIFMIGISSLAMCAFYIYEKACDPKLAMERAVIESMTKAINEPKTNK